MFSGSATGELLPPYVIYKAKNLWSTWIEGGPEGARYGISKNGWMNSENFDEWFSTTVVPWARRKEGEKVIIGDNLSSHISLKVLLLCETHNINFVLLPPHSTDKCQPLDVAFFAPQKRAWRKILEDFKMKNPSSSSLDKSIFPQLLRKLIQNTGLRNEENLKAGFRACGIVPFDPERVLSKFPKSATEMQDQNKQFQISSALLEYLQQFRYDPERKNAEKAKPKKRLSVEPGKSLSAADISTAPQPKTKSSVPTPTPGTKPSVASTSVVQEDTSSSENDSSDYENSQNLEISDLDEGDFVLVKCTTKKTKQYYVGKIERIHNDDNTVDVIFLKRIHSKTDNQIFTFPEKLDTGNVYIDDVEIKLSPPTHGDTTRTESFFYFKDNILESWPCHIN